MITFDHIAVAGANLTAATAWVRARTGVEVPTGGAHPLMGTHNRLTSTGPDSFLEILAVDPAAAPPDRARWFGLDDPSIRRRLEQAPRVHAMVARAEDLEAAIAAAAAVGVDYGRPLTLTRGDLSWRFAVRDDGLIPLDGAAPQLMEWPPGPHPAARMPDLGLRLLATRVATPHAARLTELLRALDAEDMYEAVTPLSEGSAPVLSCELETDQGARATL